MTITTNSSTCSTPEAHAAGFTVGYRQLLEALKVTAVAAKSKGTPVSRSVLIECDRASARLTTFDRDTAITVDLASSEHAAGRMLLDHAAVTRVLAATVKGAGKRHLDGLEVRLDVADGAPTLHVDGYAVPIGATATPDQFPDRPATRATTHVVDRQEFTSFFERCRIAAEREPLILPILTAVRVELGLSHIGVLATDRYRLAIGSLPATGNRCDQVLAPAATVAAVLAQLHGTEVTLGADTVHGDVWLTLGSGPVTARIRTLHGDYPTVGSILNRAGGQLTVTLPRAALAAAATRAAAITVAAADRLTPARLVVDEASITIEPGTNAAAGCTAPPIPARVEQYSTPWRTGVNPAFLLDAIASIDADDVTLHLGGPAQPLLFTAAGDSPHTDTASFRHLLQPVTIPAHDPS